MDPTTASYYRAILFIDSQDSRPLPPTLVLLHQWAIKRCQAMGLGGTISKASALTVAMTWMSTTEEGKEHTRDFTSLGDIFGEPEVPGPSVVAGESIVDWDAVPLESNVIAMSGDKQVNGVYVGRRSRAWIDVRIAGERKTFRPHQVQLAGA